MSIVRIGLGETEGFSDGYDRIFGKKKAEKKEEQPKTDGTCGTGCATDKTEGCTGEKKETA